MKKVTIVGEALATPGREFTYAGQTDEGCAACKLRKACHDLEPGRPYRVTGVRDVRHRGVCHVFEGETVRVADVEPVPLRVAIPVAALRGTGWSKRWDECGKACPFKANCNPGAVTDADVSEIVEVQGPVTCKAGRDLRFAVVKPARWTF